MALLDMASSQSSFHNHFCTSRLQILRHGTTSVKLTFRKEKRLPCIPRKLNFETGHLKMQGAFLIKAVATLEPNTLAQSEGHMKDLTLLLVPDSSSQVSQYPSKDSAETTERERLRRMRISKANKGNVAWNKGRKHSPETLQRIRERTRLAMQNPKVKEKLVNMGHAQSEETKQQIGAGIRFRWEQRCAKMRVQESCHFEWQNLIAEASRKGYAGEEEHQWYSYEVLSEQLEQEWLERLERRRSNPKPKGGSRRPPESPEQRKKISEAIIAKWNDPDYRERVCVAMSRAKRKAKDYRGWWNSQGTCKQRSTKLMALNWKNLIAEAARKGYVGQEELQWNSDEVLSKKQLKQECLEIKSIEQSRSEPKPKGREPQYSPEQRKKTIAAKWADPEFLEIKSIEQSRSEPKPKGREPQYSPEQRKKISEAIAAKWADPDYREQIYRPFRPKPKSMPKPNGPKPMKMTDWEKPLDPSLVCSWMVLNYYWTIRLNM